MSIRESGEMYLETILILSQKQSSVRSIDVCDYMHFSKPSISRAVGVLKKDGYLNMDKDGFLTLTEKGKAIAVKIYDRHKVLSQFLMNIGVSEENAVADACKMEHDISDESFEAIKKYSGIKGS